jgi:hypothetical protein
VTTGKHAITASDRLRRRFQKLRDELLIVAERLHCRECSRATVTRAEDQIWPRPAIYHENPAVWPALPSPSRAGSDKIIRGSRKELIFVCLMYRDSFLLRKPASLSILI